MRLGTYIVRHVGITLVDTMDLSEYDETPLHHRWRKQCWRNGNRIKTRQWLDRDGAERDTSENKKQYRLRDKKDNGSYWLLLNRGYIRAAKATRDRRKRSLK